MKKLLYLILLLCCKTALSQSGWIVTTPPVGGYIYPLYVNLDFIDENTGYINKDKIYKSTNGGLNWVAITSIINSNDNYTPIKFFSSGTGYILLPNSKFQVAKTTNGGVNWSGIAVLERTTFSDMQFINESTGFLITSFYTLNFPSSIVLKTTDGGSTWNQYSVADSVSASKVSFCNYNTGYIYHSGSLSKTTNGGENWAKVNGEPFNCFRLSFINEQTGWAITSNPFKASKTTNGGINWQVQNPAYDVFFLNSSTGWYCYKQIFKTTNSGNNWFPVSDTGYTFAKVKFLNENTGWCYANNNKILITHTGGTVFISKEDEEIPASFSLFQNYPNPFNPSTKIKFSIRKNEFIKINVFDIAGKHITKLVDGNLTAGTYNVDFNGKDLPSGTYFYKLEAGDFSEVKRMVLVK